LGSDRRSTKNRTEKGDGSTYGGENMGLQFRQPKWTTGVQTQKKGPGGRVGCKNKRTSGDLKRILKKGLREGKSVDWALKGTH